MRYSSLTMRWARSCKSCGKRLDEGVSAYGGKNSDDKWEFLCPGCHKDEKLNGAGMPDVPAAPTKPMGDMEAALNFIAGTALAPTGYGSFDQLISDTAREWSEKGDTVTFGTGSQRCRSCGNDIDPDTCHCGMPRKNHNDYDLGHSFVPAGCTCGYTACGHTDTEPQEKKGPEPFSKDWIKDNAVWGRI